MSKKANFIMAYSLVIFIFIFYMIMYPEKAVAPVSTFGQVMELLQDGQYPEDPYTLIDTNNKLLMCLYGGAILDEEIEPILKKQRLLFSDEMLELNPFNIHLERAKEQIESFREIDVYIHKTDIVSLEYDETDKNICYIVIRQYNSLDTHNDTLFYLAKVDDAWKIIGLSDETEYIE